MWTDEPYQEHQHATRTCCGELSLANLGLLHLGKRSCQVVHIVLADETRPVACVMPLQGPRPLPSLTFTMRLSSSDYPFWCLSREVFTIKKMVSFISLKQSTPLGPRCLVSQKSQAPAAAVA